MRVNRLIPLLAVLLAADAWAGSPADISADLKALLEKHRQIPGIVVALVKEDVVIADGAAGVRKFGDPAAMTVDDQIHLGSDTKAMTAVLIGQLIQQKQLTTDTSMNQIFPDLAGKMDPQAATITVGQLLQHTAGLPANLKWTTFKKFGGISEQRRAVVAEALSQPPAHPPGTAYLYSNTGFVVLGAIVEKFTGRSWEDVIQVKLFDPLNMRSAGFGPPDAVWGHLIRDGRPVPVQSDNPPVMGPAGRVHCTIGDWAKFVSQFEMTANHLPEIDPAALTSELKPGKVGNYGGGWVDARRPWADGPVLMHAGSNTMWYCVAWVAPKKHFATLVAVNIAGDDAEKACDQATGILIHLVNRL